MSITTREKFDSLFYKDFASYQSLSPGDQEFFDFLFNVLIVSGKINWSNEKLSSIINTPESTVEKRLKRVETAGLIIRETAKQQIHGVWRTVDRIIRLSPEYFEFDFNTAAHKFFCDYIFYKKNWKIMQALLEMPYEEFKEKFGRAKMTYVNL